MPISPTSATAGDSGFTLTVTGSQFQTDSYVTWNGSSRVTTFISSTELQAAILTSDLVDAGVAEVCVVTPGCGQDCVDFLICCPTGGGAVCPDVCPAPVTIWIDTAGNDTTGDGSNGNPYLTPQRAVQDIPVVICGPYIIQMKTPGTYSASGLGVHIDGRIFNSGGCDGPNDLGTFWPWGEVSEGFPENYIKIRGDSAVTSTYIIEGGGAGNGQSVIAMSFGKLILDGFTISSSGYGLSITGSQVKLSGMKFLNCTTHVVASHHSLIYVDNDVWVDSDTVGQYNLHMENDSGYQNGSYYFLLETGSVLTDSDWQVSQGNGAQVGLLSTYYLNSLPSLGLFGVSSMYWLGDIFWVAQDAGRAASDNFHGSGTGLIIRDGSTCSGSGSFHFTFGLRDDGLGHILAQCDGMQLIDRGNVAGTDLSIFATNTRYTISLDNTGIFGTPDPSVTYSPYGVVIADGLGNFIPPKMYFVRYDTTHTYGPLQAHSLMTRSNNQLAGEPTGLGLAANEFRLDASLGNAQRLVVGADSTALWYQPSGTTVPEWGQLVAALIDQTTSSTLSGTTPSNGDQVTIGAKTYTFFHGSGVNGSFTPAESVTANRVLLPDGPTIDGELGFLRDAINANPATAGFYYGSATVANASATAPNAPGGGALVVSAKAGVDGSTVAVSETSATLSWSSAFLTEGQYRLEWDNSVVPSGGFPTGQDNAVYVYPFLYNSNTQKFYPVSGALIKSFDYDARSTDVTAGTVLYKAPITALGSKMLFRVSVYQATQTAAAGGTLATTISFNDGLTTQTVKPAADVNLTVANQYMQGDAVIRVAENTNITFGAVISGGSGTPKYNLYIRLEAIR